MTEETTVVVRSYTTRGTEKKLLSDAMSVNKRKHVLKKRWRNTTIVEEDIHEDQVIRVEGEKEVSWTEFEEDLITLRTLTEVTKPSSQGPKPDPKILKKNTRKARGVTLLPLGDQVHK